MVLNSLANLSVSVPQPLRYFSWGFGRSDDSNYDRWPDQWLRYSGIGFPKFVRAELVARDLDFESGPAS